MFKKIKESADFPPGIIGGFYIEFFSKNEAVLTGDVEIEKLSDMVLKIKYNEHHIMFSGKELEIKNFSSTGIRINGNITSMEFL